MVITLINCSGSDFDNLSRQMWARPIDRALFPWQLLPRNRIDRGKAERVCACASVKPFLTEHMLSRGVTIAQAPLQR
jgi:hypothetical protein